MLVDGTLAGAAHGPPRLRARSPIPPCRHGKPRASQPIPGASSADRALRRGARRRRLARPRRDATAGRPPARQRSRVRRGDVGAQRAGVRHSARSSAISSRLRARTPSSPGCTVPLHAARSAASTATSSIASRASAPTCRGRIPISRVPTPPATSPGAAASGAASWGCRTSSCRRATARRRPTPRRRRPASRTGASRPLAEASAPDATAPRRPRPTRRRRRVR